MNDNNQADRVNTACAALALAFALFITVSEARGDVKKEHPACADPDHVIEYAIDKGFPFVLGHWKGDSTARLLVEAVNEHTRGEPRAADEAWVFRNMKKAAIVVVTFHNGCAVASANWQGPEAIPIWDIIRNARGV